VYTTRHTHPRRVLIAALAALSLTGTTTVVALDPASAQPCPRCHDTPPPPPPDGGTH
jgi:hypothetical protein